MRDVLAMVLAGGKPTKDQFSVLTMNRSKASLPFGGLYRLIDFTLSSLMNSNIEKVGIITQFLPSSLIDHISDGFAWDMKGYERFVKILPPFVSYDNKDAWYKGTGDALRQNLNFIYDHAPEYVFILSGENVHNIDFKRILDFFKSENGKSLLVYKNLSPEQYCHRFGYVEVEGNKIVKMYEKPDKPMTEYVSAGIYLFKKDFFLKSMEKYDKKNLPFDFVKDVIIHLIEEGEVLGYECKGEWEYVRDYYNYYRLHLDVIDGKLPIRNWNVLTNLEDRNTGFRPSTQIKNKGVISDSLVAPGCIIEGEVFQSVLFPGVKIGKNTKVHNSIIMHDTIIGKSCLLNGVICDKDVIIEDGRKIGEEEVGKLLLKEDLVLIGKGAVIKNDIPKGKHIKPSFIL